MVYSVSASSMFSIDEDGKHSLEVTYKDSDGFNTGAYAEGDNFDAVLADVLNQIDAAKADRDDARANEEEAKQLQTQIDDLTRQLADAQNKANLAQQSQTILSNLGRFVAWAGSGAATSSAVNS